MIFKLWSSINLVVLYSNQWMNETLLYKYISLILFSKRGTQFVVSLRERRRDIYSKRGPLLAPYLLPGARGCQCLHPLASRIVRDDLTPLIGCMSLAQLSILCTLSKSDCVVITWSPSGYTPVGPECPDMLPHPCLLITTWQLVRAHGVTRIKSKIHVICYITVCVYLSVYADTCIYIYLHTYIHMNIFWGESWINFFFFFL